jgi:methionyl-tRNA formyltransferase
MRNVLIVNARAYGGEISPKSHNGEYFRWVCDGFNMDIAIDLLSPAYIFFVHWSKKIPKEIYENYNCILFHMTDLPYGRGGSPLQNLIKAGKKETVITAIEVTEEIDAGPWYMKEPLSLDGTAEEIYDRAYQTIDKMITEFLDKLPESKPQEGSVTVFKRRKPGESEIPADIKDIEKLYDHIRMLDATGYPPAYLDKDGYRYFFNDPNFMGDTLYAKVQVRKI